jgi:hypothetical protein
VEAHHLVDEVPRSITGALFGVELHARSEATHPNAIKFFRLFILFILITNLQVNYDLVPRPQMTPGAKEQVTIFYHSTVPVIALKHARLAVKPDADHRLAQSSAHRFSVASVRREALPAGSSQYDTVKRGDLRHT